jgi:hypothetical protein
MSTTARTAEQIAAVQNMSGADFVTLMGTKSAAIRKLSADGMSKGDISRYLEIRFQHVRNVLVTPLKKG